MPREIYDPKNPELEFYNENPPRVFKPAPRRPRSIMANRWFMVIYGLFITMIVAGIFLYRYGLLPKFDFLSKYSKPLFVKIKEVEYINDNLMYATVEVRNVNYTNSQTIHSLKVNWDLYYYRKHLESGYDSYYNIIFPKGQRIGFKIPIDYSHWKKSTKLKIALTLDEENTIINNISTQTIVARRTK